MSSIPISENNMFRVITFNLRRDGLFHRKCNSWLERRQRVANLIMRSDAAVVGVQELMPQMREDVRSILEGYSIFGMGRSGEAMGEHSDIMIKNDVFDILRHDTFWLSKRPSEIASRAYFSFFPRICTVGEIYLRGTNKKVRVFNTHFDHICGPARTLGVYTILGYLNRMQEIDPMPSIIMGDLNAKPGSHPIQIMRNNLHGFDNISLTDAYAYCHENHSMEYTYHGFSGKKGRRLLDYIFVTDGLQVVESHIDQTNDGGLYPSDHYPLMATLRFSD